MFLFLFRAGFLFLFRVIGADNMDTIRAMLTSSLDANLKFSKPQRRHTRG